MMVPLNVLNAIYFICRYVKFQRREREEGVWGVGGGGGRYLSTHVQQS